MSGGGQKKGGDSAGGASRSSPVDSESDLDVDSGWDEPEATVTGAPPSAGGLELDDLEEEAPMTRPVDSADLLAQAKLGWSEGPVTPRGGESPASLPISQGAPTRRAGDEELVLARKLASVSSERDEATKLEGEGLGRRRRGSSRPPAIRLGGRKWTPLVSDAVNKAKSMDAQHRRPTPAASRSSVPSAPADRSLRFSSEGARLVDEARRRPTKASIEVQAIADALREQQGLGPEHAAGPIVRQGSARSPVSQPAIDLHLPDELDLGPAPSAGRSPTSRSPALMRGDAGASTKPPPGRASTHEASRAPAGTQRSHPPPNAGPGIGAPRVPGDLASRIDAQLSTKPSLAARIDAQLAESTGQTASSRKSTARGLASRIDAQLAALDAEAEHGPVSEDDPVVELVVEPPRFGQRGGGPSPQARIEVNEELLTAEEESSLLQAETGEAAPPEPVAAGRDTATPNVARDTATPSVARDTATPTGPTFTTPIPDPPAKEDPDAAALAPIVTRFQRGDYLGALMRAEALLEDRPDFEAARRYADSAKDLLMEMYLAKLGDRDQVPLLVMKAAEVQELSLDHRAGFLMSLLDGVATIDDVLDMSGMAALDALRLLFEMREKGVIVVRAGGR